MKKGSKKAHNTTVIAPLGVCIADEYKDSAEDEYLISDDFCIRRITNKERAMLLKVAGYDKEKKYLANNAEYCIAFRKESKVLELIDIQRIVDLAKYSRLIVETSASNHNASCGILYEGRFEMITNLRARLFIREGMNNRGPKEIINNISIIHMHYLVLLCECILKNLAKEKLKEKTKMILRRYDEFLSIGPKGERFVEAMIMLEALLILKSESGELSTSLAIRGSKIYKSRANTTAEQEERMKAYQNIKKCYNLRSALIHTGLAETDEKYDEIGKFLYAFVREIIVQYLINPQGFSDENLKRLLILD